MFKKGIGLIKKTFIYSFFTIFILLLVRSVVIEVYKIPSGSMIPSLIVGDVVIVNKMAYGLRIPFTDIVFSPKYLFTRKIPDRGDVIVFKYPRNIKRNYIKRVVGVPGDIVEVKNKVLHITGNQAHIVQKLSGNSVYSEKVRKIIPPGNFFVMGDNRDSSHDSRTWGFVPYEYIMGRAEYIFFSIDFSRYKKDLKFRSDRYFEKI